MARYSTRANHEYSWRKKTLRSFDLAPDGTRFAAVQELTSEQNGSTQLTFLLNFFDELRRRAPAAGK
ncbi:MAG: hypothetical protein DMG57_34625 [Acidobacteria bacterium]|nr:MAG: hypothetical protein DMG57_34625 [Acidobacteriota bacterium]